MPGKSYEEAFTLPRPVSRHHPSAAGIFSCAVDGHPAQRLAALRWFASLTAIAGAIPQDLIVFNAGEGSFDVFDYLRTQGVTVQAIPPSRLRMPLGDTIAGALALATMEVQGVAVLTPTDVVLLEDARSTALPPRSVALPTRRAQTRPASAPPALLAAATQLTPPASGYASLAPLDLTLLLDVRHGLILIPGDLLAEVARAWSQCATFLLEHPDAAESWEPFIAAVALRMALTRSGFGIHELDSRWSVSTDGSVSANSCDGKPAALHYGDRVDQTGLLMRANMADVDKRIAEVNTVVHRLWQEAFPSATFWEWRYQDNPELGSGIGSRGLALKEKRQLLKALFNLLKPRSVLDVGCGDGEATRGLPIPRYIGIDLSPTAVARARLSRPEGEFQVGTLTYSCAETDLTLCLDMLIHQSSAEDYKGIVRSLCARSGAVLVSGWEQRPAGTSPMVHFHETLSTTIMQYVPEAQTYPLRKRHGITTLLILKPGQHHPSGSQTAAAPTGQTPGTPARHKLPLHLRLGLWRLRLQFAALGLARVMRGRRTCLTVCSQELLNRQLG